jgi:hypothetical protein
MASLRFVKLRSVGDFGLCVIWAIGFRLDGDERAKVVPEVTGPRSTHHMLESLTRLPQVHMAMNVEGPNTELYR